MKISNDPIKTQSLKVHNIQSNFFNGLITQSHNIPQKSPCDPRIVSKIWSILKKDKKKVKIHIKNRINIIIYLISVQFISYEQLWQRHSYEMPLVHTSVFFRYKKKLKIFLQSRKLCSTCCPRLIRTIVNQNGNFFNP